MAKIMTPLGDTYYSSTVRKIFDVDKFGKAANLEKSITFAATTTGATGAHTIATVTGTVAISIFAVVNTSATIQAGATIEVGTATTTAGLIAQTAGDTLDANEIWHDASPDASIELTSVLKDNIVSEDVIYTVATDTIDTGAITFYIRWAPISSDGNVVISS